MRKSDLIEIYAAKLNIPIKEAELQVNTVFETFIQGVERDGISEISKVIRIEKVPTKARKARNPQTGEKVHVAAGYKLKTTLLKNLKKLVGK